MMDTVLHGSSVAIIVCYVSCYVFQTHVLRKNVQVRKSQSADNLAPSMIAAIQKEHDINLVCASVRPAM